MALLLLFFGCAQNLPSRQVHVDLITDFVPGIEFDGIRIQVGEGELALRSDHLVDRTRDYVRGTRLASLPVPPGDSRLRVTLFRSTEAIVHRDVVITIGPNDQAVTVVISRNCRGVVCPASGNPSLDTCLGGRCVDPRCTPETREFCPPEECTADGMCSVASCADGVCANGVCLALSHPERCATNEYCDGYSGCIFVSPEMDAGVTDAGTGWTDMGAPDSSRDSSVDSHPSPTCGDGIRNAEETDIDCGGPRCAPCTLGFMCVLPSDCVDSCVLSRCAGAPSCVDGIRNGAESDIDCGGEDCAPCNLGRTCRLSTDCTSALCIDTLCSAVPLCENGRQDTGEADVDCGGTCPVCEDGRSCTEGGQCASGHCDLGRCALQACYDGIRNGSETDVDCGGPCLKCLGAICFVGAECASGSCAIDFECE